MGSVITMAQTKGGAGKTTLAQLIVGVVKQGGHSVGVIDSDVNHTLATWIEKFAKLDVEARVVTEEMQVVSWAEELEGKNDLVVIDTAGAKNQASLYAIGVADFVLIPVQPSSANVIEAYNTYQTVLTTSKMVGREVPAKVVFTDYTPNTNISQHIRQEVKNLELPTMRTILHRLVAFQELSYGEVPKTGTAGAQAGFLVKELAEIGALPFMQKVEMVEEMA